jgi:DNA-binding IclR family transcriptional regulator
MKGKKKSQSKSAYSTPALEKGLDVIELLAHQPAGLTKSQIARELDRTVSEIFRMLVCLEGRGYISQVHGDQYELTLKLFKLVQDYPPTERLIVDALPVMRRFTAQTMQSCHLGVIEGGRVVILAQVNAPTSVGFYVKLGSSVDIMDASTGYVILAHQDVIKNHALFLLRPRADAQTEEERRQTIEEINAEASLAIGETRTISYNLRPFQLDRLGLSEAIEALVRSASRATNIHFTTSIADIDDSFPEELRINFYRIVQEATNNIMKHSGAGLAEIRVEKTSHGISLSIRDNGTGFVPDHKSASVGKGGFGLTGIRERASLLGGIVDIQSQPGAGTFCQ